MIYPFNGLEISWKRKEIVQDQFARLVNSRFEELLNDFEIVFILMRSRRVISSLKIHTRSERIKRAMHSLLPHDYPQEQIHYINYTKCEDVFDSEGHVNPEAFDKYSSLRFFSICPVNLIQIDDM